MARFSVWNGVRINPQHQSLPEIAAVIEALKPRGRWSREWLVKAGEGGTWQAAWDGHLLALDGPEKLRALYQEGRGLRPRLWVTPYVVVRGRPQWDAAEWRQIAECAAVTGRVVLNLEDGPQYWNGDTDPDLLRANYLEPLAATVRSIGAQAGRLGHRVHLQLCAIPRAWSVASLGGVDAINAWLSYCRSAAWECYDAAAPDLDVALSMERLEQLGVWGDPQWRIPVVNRSRIDAWACSPRARRGLQVWHLDGD